MVVVRELSLGLRLRGQGSCSPLAPAHHGSAGAWPEPPVLSSSTGYIPGQWADVGSTGRGGVERRIGLKQGAFLLLSDGMAGSRAGKRC